MNQHQLHLVIFVNRSKLTEVEIQNTEIDSEKLIGPSLNVQVGKAGGEKWKSMSESVSSNTFSFLS